MSKRTSTLLVAALIAGATTGVMLINRAEAQDADTRGQDIANEIVLEKCMVGYINKVEIPAEVQGRIDEIMIEEGRTIKKDDLVATVDDSQAKLAIDLNKAKEEEAILNATNDVNLRDAREGAKIARAEAESYIKLYEEKATPYWEMKKKVMEADRAELRIELAELQEKIAKVQYFGARAELRIAEDELTRRQIKAPFDGFIERREVQLGQWVQPGSPIATLVQMDKLKVEGKVDALRYSGKVSRGTPVRVLIYYNDNNAAPIEINAVLTYVSTEIDTNNRYRVWVEIPNKPLGDDWQLKPGMRAKIMIQGSARPNQLF